MCYNVVVSMHSRVIIEGTFLSFAGLEKVMEMMNEYAGFTEVACAIHSISGVPQNVIKYLPLKDFRFSPNKKTAALIPLEDFDGDDEDDDEEDGEEWDEPLDGEDPLDTLKRWSGLSSEDKI